MKINSLCWACCAALILLSPTVTQGESSQESFTRGEQALAKGDFHAALASFANAARADRSRAEYLQHYAMVRRVIDLRTQLDAATDPAQWNYLARALRSFYHSERIYPEALALEKEIYAREKSASSAVMLAETQLAMKQDADAVETLSSVATDQATPRSQALLAVALARTGNADRARDVAASVQLPAGADANSLYAAARMHSAVGEHAQATALITACLEAVLPSQSPGFVAHARTCPEFSAIATTAEFTRALATPSKVAESKCSGGSSCASCPMRGGCPKSQAQ